MKVRVETIGHSKGPGEQGGLAYADGVAMMRAGWLTKEQLDEVIQGKVVEYADNNFSYTITKV